MSFHVTWEWASHSLLVYAGWLLRIVLKLQIPRTHLRLLCGNILVFQWSTGMEFVSLTQRTQSVVTVSQNSLRGRAVHISRLKRGENARCAAFSFFPKRSGGCSAEAFVVAKQPSAALSVTGRKFRHMTCGALAAFWKVEMFLSLERTSASLPLWARIPCVYIWNNELERAKDAICERPLIRQETRLICKRISGDITSTLI